MYKIAQINSSKCSQSSCRLCTIFCPEPNTILYDEKRKSAYIAIDRCKGCGACIGICNDIAKRGCISMVAVGEVQNGFAMSKYGFPCKSMFSDSAYEG